MGLSPGDASARCGEPARTPVHACPGQRRGGSCSAHRPGSGVQPWEDAGTWTGADAEQPDRKGHVLSDPICREWGDAERRGDDTVLRPTVLHGLPTLRVHTKPPASTCTQRAALCVTWVSVKRACKSSWGEPRAQRMLRSHCAHPSGPWRGPWLRTGPPGPQAPPSAVPRRCAGHAHSWHQAARMQDRGQGGVGTPGPATQPCRRSSTCRQAGPRSGPCGPGGPPGRPSRSAAGKSPGSRKAAASWGPQRARLRGTRRSLQGVLV